MKKIWLPTLCVVLAITLVGSVVFFFQHKKRREAIQAAWEAKRQACILPQHQVLNTEILETDTFLDTADRVVYYNKSFAEMRELSEEEGVKLKNAFRIWPYEIRKVKSRFEDDPMEMVKTQLALYGGIEFRYGQRRAYAGESIAYRDLQNDLDVWRPGHRDPYDAVLVVPNGIRSFWIVLYLER